MYQVNVQVSIGGTEGERHRMEGGIDRQSSNYIATMAYYIVIMTPLFVTTLLIVNTTFLYRPQDSTHQCDLVCGKRLQCGNHFCTEGCHRGHCDQCWEYSESHVVLCNLYKVISAKVGISLYTATP